MTLTKAEQEEFAELLAITLAKTLQQARSVSDSIHYDHHRWIEEQIKKEQLRAKFWGKMLEHVTRWGIISIVSAIGFALYLGLKAVVLTWLKANGVG